MPATEVDDKTIERIEALLPEAMLADKHAALAEIKRIRRQKGSRRQASVAARRLASIEERLSRSAIRKSERKNGRPSPAYPETLPILEKRSEIIEAIQNHPVVIVSGETGSGKTTQLPKFCLEAGRGIDGVIGCTQPRRIAAVTVTQRISEELGEEPGRTVGYQIRFQEHFNREAGYIKVMTDGILLAEAQGDRYLNDYDTIIVDEAHERSLNIDFLLGILRRLLRLRKDLKLVITSATIDTEKFSRAFDGAPVVEVSGRTYPVEVLYEDFSETDTGEEPTYVEKAVAAVDRVVRQKKRGDILVFMPTEQDIRETCELIEGRGFRHTRVLPLYARLSAPEQMRVFASMAERKIVVSTNVAETSITVPGIRYVIDTGLARISQYDPRSRTTSLPISPISRSSADQRKGRCGRVEEGVCIRLYPEHDYESRPLFTPPEIQRANLSEVILRMLALDLGDIASFPFIDPPPAKQIKDGFALLEELGAIASAAAKKKGAKGRSRSGFQLTSRGRSMVRIPLDPRLSRILIEAAGNACLAEVTAVVSALSVIDPRDRPEGSEKQAEAAHARFSDPYSDFVTWINIFRACFGEPTLSGAFVKARELKVFCRENFFSFKRMREWQDVYEQIAILLAEAGVQENSRPYSDADKSRRNASGEEGFSNRYTAIHCSMLAGFLSNIGLKKEKNIYQAPKNREMMIFPGSSVFNKGGDWIVCAEMVATSRLFARCVATISGSWLEPVGGSLCRYTYRNPRWEKKREAVMADEQVSLFGLVIETGRPVRYGPIDPEGATEIFIRQALIEGHVKKEPDFMRHNREEAEAVRDMENRLRRRDLLVGEEDLFAFYKECLGTVYDMAGLRKEIKRKGSDRFLRMERDALLARDPDEEALSLYPDGLPLGDGHFTCTYRFEPGAPADGVTVSLPVHAASAVAMEKTDWIVPGLLPEKIGELIRTLPKAYRKKLVPVNETVGRAIREMPLYQGSLKSALSRFLHERFNVEVPVSEWREEELPEHLRLRFAITGSGGRELAAGRDKKLLLGGGPAEAGSDDFLSTARKKWERTGITGWDFDHLPEAIEIREGRNRFPLYPALKPSTEGVDLRLFQDRSEALATHRAGVCVLFRCHFAKDLKFLRKTVSLPASTDQAARYFGGRKALEGALVDRVMDDLFGVDIRSREAFLERAAARAEEILPLGDRLVRAVVPVIDQYTETRGAIYDLELRHQGKKLIPDFLAGLRVSLSRLVPEGFVGLYSMGRLGHLPRYINALRLRAERGVMDLDKDQRKAEQVKPFNDELTGFLRSLDAAASDEKRCAVEDFFWMIEEFKVSLFAQELKTPAPISAKRLKRQADAIRRMV
jgi:ATP-dependent helicase HrpA